MWLWTFGPDKLDPKDFFIGSLISSSTALWFATKGLCDISVWAEDPSLWGRVKVFFLILIMFPELVKIWPWIQNRVAYVCGKGVCVLFYISALCSASEWGGVILEREARGSSRDFSLGLNTLLPVRPLLHEHGLSVYGRLISFLAWCRWWTGAIPLPLPPPPPHPLSLAHETVLQCSITFVDAWSRGGEGLVACLTSQQHASVSQEPICSDNFTCCHTDIEVCGSNFPSHPVTAYWHRADQS